MASCSRRVATCLLLVLLLAFCVSRHSKPLAPKKSAVSLLLRRLNEMKLALEFAGGMELLFANQRELEVDIPGDSTAVNVKTALAYIRDCVLVDTARADMFMKGSTIRPGVLVLINDADWELTGMEESGTCGDGDCDDVTGPCHPTTTTVSPAHGVRMYIPTQSSKTAISLRSSRRCMVADRSPFLSNCRPPPSPSSSRLLLAHLSPVVPLCTA